MTDSTGAVLPDATVTIRNLGTQEIRRVTAGANGDCTATLLQVGSYSAAVQMTGFRSFTDPKIALAAGDRACVDATLEVGESNETVKVGAEEAPVIQSENATVGSRVTSEGVENVPLNRRNFAALVELSPGANEGISPAICILL